MKKIALVLLVIAIFVCLTACSQDQYAKLGELMGKMSSNVYGIKPNMKDVDAAEGEVDSTVKVDATTGTVTVEIKSEDAKNIVDSVVAVMDSSSKREALQETLDQPILSEDATELQKTEVQKAITKQATDSKIDTTGYTEERKELAEAVNEALDLVGESLSENPTKAELATVAIIKTLSDAVKEDKGYAEAGKKAIDALTITAEAAGIDLFADADMTDLINNITGRGISRDSSSEDLPKWLPVISKSAASVIRCMTGADKKFSDQRYSKFILECRAIRAAFEMMAKAYSVPGDIDAILTKDIDLGLTIESLGRYAVALVFTELTDLSRPEKGQPDGVRGFLESYINGNYDALTDLANKYNELPDPTASDSPYYEAYDHATTCIANGIGIVTTDFKDADELVTAVREALGNKLERTAFNMLSVTGMILVDSEWTKLIALGGLDGTLSGLHMLIMGKEVNE